MCTFYAGALFNLESVKVSFRGYGRADNKIVASLHPFERCMNSRLHVDAENVWKRIIRHLSLSCRKDSCKSSKCSCRVAVHVGLQECTCGPNVHVGLGLGVQNVSAHICVCSVYSMFMV